MKYGRVTFKHVLIEDLRNLTRYVWYVVFKMLSCNTTLHLQQQKTHLHNWKCSLSLSLNQPSKVQNSFPNISPSERDLSFYFIMFTRGSGGCAIFGLVSFMAESGGCVRYWDGFGAGVEESLCKINGGDETWWWLLLLILLITVDGIVYTWTLKKSTKVTYVHCGYLQLNYWKWIFVVVRRT